MEKTLEEYKELVFLALCAFIEEDGLSHCSLQNFKALHLGDKKMKKTINILKKDGRIIDHTVNGFYRRYEIINPEDCPDFIFNERLTVTNKLFILYCLNNLTDFYQRPARELALDLRGSDNYKFESKQLCEIKKALNMTMFDYIDNINYIKCKLYDKNYPVIKTENGYQIDSEPKAQECRGMTIHEKYITKRNRYKLNAINKSIGYYLILKLKNRIKSDPDRFSDYDITEDFLNELYENQNKCDFYTKLPFNDLTQISIDRIDSNKSYTKDNVVLTTTTINYMKGTILKDEFIKICKQIASVN